MQKIGLGLLILATIGLLGADLDRYRIVTTSAPKRLLRTSVTVHDFTDQEYLAPQPTEVKGYVAFVFHDGYDSFFTHAVALSDSIYEGLGAYSAYAGQRIKLTCAVPPTLVGTANHLSLQQLRACARQGVFEIAGHGEDQHRLGNSGLDAGGDQVAYGTLTGMSYRFIDTVFGAAQDSCAAWDIPLLTSWVYTNWRTIQPSLPEIARANGIYQAISAAFYPVETKSSLDTNYGGTGEEYTAQQLNVDPYPAAAINKPQSGKWGGFQRIGRLGNPYDIGSRGSWNRTGNDAPAGQADTSKAWLDMCAQMQCVGIWAGHDITDAGGAVGDLDIEMDELSALFVHAAARQQEGLLETVTLEQAVQAMRGYRDGNLMNHYGFRLLTDGVATPLRDGSGNPIVAPIGWPVNTELYPNGNQEFVASGGTATNPKVHNLGAVDTVRAAFIIRDGDANEVSYAGADTSRNIILQRANTVNYGYGTSVPIVTTGTSAKYIKVALEATFLLDVLPGTPQAFPMMRALQFEESWDDHFNDGTEAYESMAEIVQYRAAAPNFSEAAWHSEKQRVRPRGGVWMADTTQTVYGATTGITGNEAWAYRSSPFNLRPYLMHNKGAAWDIQQSIGNPLSFSAAGNAANSGLTELELFDNVANCHEWVWYIPVDDRTDFVYFMVSIEREGSDYTGAWELAILAWDAYPIR